MIQYTFVIIGFILVMLLAGSHFVQPAIQQTIKRIGRMILVLAFLIPVMGYAQTKNVGTVKASDYDPGQTITYSITAGNTGSYFAIDSKTGLVTVKLTAYNTFTRQRTFTLTVKVSDDGKIIQTNGSVQYVTPLWKKATVTVVLKKTTTATGEILNSSELIYQI